MSDYKQNNKPSRPASLPFLVSILLVQVIGLPGTERNLFHFLTVLSSGEAGGYVSNKTKILKDIGKEASLLERKLDKAQSSGAT